MMLTVKTLIEYLSRQNPDAKICCFNTNRRTYEQIDGKLFKKVSHAKDDYIKVLNGIYSEIEDEDEKNEKISDEIRESFGNVTDDDILLGLENRNNTLDNYEE